MGLVGQIRVHGSRPKCPCAPHDEPTTGRPSVALPATVNLVGFLVALNVLRVSLLVVLCSLN